MISLLFAYAPALLRGLGTTALLTLVVWSVGLVGGVLVGLLFSAGSASGRILRSMVVLVSAIPVLVILFWLHYPAQALLGVVIDPFVTTATALSLLNILLIAEVVSRTIASLPAEWTLMARATGLPTEVVARSITFPLAARQLVGPVVLIQISMLHATLFGSLISVNELFRTVQTINAVEYKPVELYSFLALFFLVICAPLQVVAATANKLYSRDLSLK